MDTSVTGSGYADAAANTGPIDVARILPELQSHPGAQSPPSVWFRDDRPLTRPAPSGVADHPSEYQERPRRARGPITVPQRVGAILLTLASVAGVAWYVPRIVAADSHSFTGTVTTTGITDLNFASAGRVGTVLIRLGANVKAGQVLASELSPRTTAVLNADRAAIAADQAILKQLQDAQKTSQTDIAAAKAQLAKDQAQLAADRVRRVETEILAPSSGTVVAINGQVGETVSAGGIHNYSSQAPSSSAQQPAFSLLPEGPRSSVTGKTTESALPMIALRTSAGWFVNILIPQSEVAAVRPGQRAIITVPAIRLKVNGVVQGLSPTPVNTSTGVAYQVAINIVGHQRVTPFSGMTADVQLLS
jgi:multidrug efflux pump subunit AcrA (membrane-fusion protein)